MKGTKLILICVLIFAFCRSFGQQNKIDSLLSVLKTANQDTNKVKTAIRLYKTYNNKTGDYNLVLSNVDTTIKLATKLDFKFGLSELYLLKGLAYMNTQQHPQALENFLISLNIAEQMAYFSQIAVTNQYIGFLYAKQNSFENAYSYFQKSADNYMALHDTASVAKEYCLIGAFYNQQWEYETDKNPDLLNKALSYNLKYLKHVKSSSLPSMYANLAMIYSNMQNYDSAIACVERSISLNKKENVNKGGDGILDLALIYTRKKELDNAWKYVQEYNGLLQNEITDTADSYFLILWEYYLQKKDYVHAYENHFKYVKAQERARRSQNADQVSQIQFNYLSEQQAKIRLLEEKANEDKHNAEVRQKKIIIYAVSLGLILMLLLAFIILRSYLQKQRANKSLAEKNKLIFEQKKNVEDKQKEILDSIHYAKRIQQSLLPTEKYIEKNIKRLLK